MGWIVCVRCEKSRCDFVAQTFALIGPIQYVLQQVSCSYGTIPNARKYYKTDRNISLGSNGEDWVHSLRKSRRDFVARTFALIAPIHPVLHRVSCSYVPNAPKHYETHQKHEFRVQWGGLGALVAKNSTRLRGTNICINWTSSVCFATSFMQLRKDPKCIEIL